MGSDAKIGLLLGLVFIFIIAFIINGLPKFRSGANNSELTTNMVSYTNEPPGIADKERKVQESLDFMSPPGKQLVGEVPAPVVANPNILRNNTAAAGHLPDERTQRGHPNRSQNRFAATSDACRPEDHR